MMPRLAAIAIGYIMGIVAVLEHDAPALWSLAPILIGTLWILTQLVREKKWVAIPTWQVVIAALALGFGVGVARTSKVAGPTAPNSLESILADTANKQVFACRGRIDAQPDLRDDGRLDIRILVNEIRIGDETASWQPVSSGTLGVSVRLYKSAGSEEQAWFDSLVHPRSYGDTVELAARWSENKPPRNLGGFDYSTFLKQEGLAGQVRARASAVTLIEEQVGNPVIAFSLLVKADFLETYRQVIRNPSSRLAAGTTLGVRRGLDQTNWRDRSVVDAFRHAGVGHVLAVSGLHVSIISILLYALLALTGIKPQKFVPVLILFLILFAILTGARPSSVRATIMNASILIIFCYFRSGLKGAVFTGLALSSTFILLHNPLALYSAGFLLSFGAVLSLVLLSPVIDDFLCSLRGWSMALACIWFGTMVIVSCRQIRLFIDPPFLIAASGLLWLAIVAGTALNEKYPIAWRIGFDRLPRSVRMFLGAQLAIQIGMMIPLSAWFFGKMPIGGMFVNLIAIPLVGVVVQVAMLVGLLGLIPSIGTTLAAPLGAVCTGLGIVFFELAWWGSEWFPFPTIPRPTLWWMAMYYAALFCLIISHRKRYVLRDFLYGLFKKVPDSSGARWALRWLAPIALSLTTVYAISPRPAAFNTVHVMIDRGAPKVILTSSHETAIIINSGSSYFASRELFESMRTLGAVEIDHAIVTGFESDHGYQGIPALREMVPVRHVWMPEIADSADDMLEAMADPYFAKQIKANKRWAKATYKAWGTFADAAEINHLSRMPIDQFTCDWRGVNISVLPQPDPLPDRFIASARTRPILIERSDGYRWLIVSDGTRETVSSLPKADVLILGDLSYRGDSFKYWTRNVIDQVEPSQTYIGGKLVAKP